MPGVPRGEFPYSAAHRRVRAEKGPASALSCLDCLRPAAHWSYVGGDPNELVDDARGSAYSLDLSRYVPRCVPCHKKFDLNQPTPAPAGASTTN